MWPACSRWSARPISRKNSPSRQVHRLSRLRPIELRGSISSRGSVALRPGFRRARSRGPDLSQRRAILGGLLGDVAARAGRGMAGSHRGIGQRARGALQLLLSVSSATRCWWFRRAACGRRPNRPRFATRARTSFRFRWSNRCCPTKQSTKIAGPWMARANAWCRRDQGRGPFRVALRSSAGVDRLQPGGRRDPFHSLSRIRARRRASGPSSSSPTTMPPRRWKAPVRSALLLLADSGFGGERSRGWGRSEAPEWQPWTAAASCRDGAAHRTGALAAFALHAG